MTRTKTAGKGIVFLWAFIFFLLAQVHSYAQAPASGAQKISGKIVSSSTGTPVAGATITVKGTKNAVVSDENGNFSILVAPNEHLLVSFIGYATKEIKLGT